MSFGNTIKQIKTEIQSITAKLHNIHGVYGFGSFFRSEHYNDVDILVVTSPDCKDTLSIFYLINKKLQRIDENLEIDLTLLTYDEFIEKPLIEIDALTLIYVSFKDDLNFISSDNYSIHKSIQADQAK